MVVYKSTAVINFAHGDLMLLGAYVVFTTRNDLGLPFVPAALLAIVLMAGLGWTIERTVLRRMVGKPAFAVVMITLGLAIIFRQIIASGWGFEDRVIRDPWGAARIAIGAVRLNAVSIATIVVAAVLLLGFFAFFRYTKLGVAMRATAVDQEAALAVGIPVHRIHALSWAIAAGVATVGGIFIASFPSTLSPGLGVVALRAFPAAILGGLDSPGGAVLGGVVIGLIEVLMQGYQPRIAPWLGNNFHVVAAYAVMILVLMVRPYGLFGTREVERV